MKRRTPILPRFLPVVVFILILPRGASAQGCEHEAQRTASAASAGVERVRIIAHAGSLEVTGRGGASQVAARGRACASEADDLAELVIRVHREGATLVVEATHPDDDNSSRNDYAYLDLIVDLPQGMPVSIEDGSGDMTVTGVGAARVNDGSGDIRLRDIAGALDVNDGSGEITIANVSGSVDIEDGSGNIEISTARGDVEVNDGSGNVTADEIGGSVRVDDGSGEIRLTDVVRSVTVDDGSGSIRVERIGGDFTVDEAGSGDVSYDDVTGRVRIDDDD